jgi:hypothetical protein
MTWVQRPSGLIKSGTKRKRFLRESTFIKFENVSWKQISVIDLNIIRYQESILKKIFVTDKEAK